MLWLVNGVCLTVMYPRSPSITSVELEGCTCCCIFVWFRQLNTSIAIWFVAQRSCVSTHALAPVSRPQHPINLFRTHGVSVQQTRRHGQHNSVPDSIQVACATALADVHVANVARPKSYTLPSLSTGTRCLKLETVA